jgi:NADH:ubiquinone oxidoreductase subunit K
MIGVACIIIGLSVSGLMLRSSFLGLMISVHLLALATSVLFLEIGNHSGQADVGTLMAWFGIWVGVSSLLGGLALSVRWFSLRATSETDEFKEMRG